MDKLAAAKEVLKSRFPEMADTEPSITDTEYATTIFTFKKTFQTPDGTELPRVVRITLNHSGNVFKIASSRG